MNQAAPLPRRRRWPLVVGALLLFLAGLWTGLWYAAAGIADRTIAGWKVREAQAGRVYTCATQTIGGFPFGIQVQCADVGAELKSSQPPLAVMAKDVLISARVWQPTVLTSEIIGPLTIAEPGQAVSLAAHWSRAQTEVRGLPTSPEKVSIKIEAPAVDRARGGENLFKASRLELDGRMVSGTVQDHPVIEIALKLVAAVAPSWHPAAARPVDADITAVLRGLNDFSPKPWAARLRELQAAGGRIDIAHARMRQGDTLAVANGVLGLSPSGRLDGELRLTVANLEQLLPALGLDQMMAQQKTPKELDSAFGALDRIMPGLGNMARQNAGPMIVASINLMGQPTELEGQRAVMLPLRFKDGAVSLGPVMIGYMPPLF
ncbi:MAG: DUF2125 domain-containing protein [Xanthobacteraceae bacterium]